MPARKFSPLEKALRKDHDKPHLLGQPQLGHLQVQVQGRTQECRGEGSPEDVEGPQEEETSQKGEKDQLGRRELSQ